MKVAGIIAEYNPFHNGHQYHIEETRRLTGADYIIVIMSGDFVQRGEPALLDKYTRTSFALEGGADLVIELPTAYACASAEAFACGAVATLNRLGVVDVLSFGSESDDDTLAARLAALYQEEPEAFSIRLRDGLCRGLTYPQARAAATEELLRGEVASSRLQTFLSSPNCILALEYRRALLRFHSSIAPLAIARRGIYHSTALPCADSVDYASASAIRRTMLTAAQEGTDSACLADLLKDQVPASVLDELISRRDYMCTEDFSAVLGYALLSSRNADLSQYLDISPDLANRIRTNLTIYSGWSDFAGRLKTRQLTRTRVDRALLHLLLHLRTDRMKAWADGGFAYYARILGFHKKSAPLLSELKKRSTIPLLTKMADARQCLENFYSDNASLAQDLLDTDLFAADLYETMAATHYGRPKKDEYTHGLILPQ